MISWREVYLLKPDVVKLKVEVDDGRWLTGLRDQISESVT
jgi:hypothetical protein